MKPKDHDGQLSLMLDPAQARAVTEDAINRSGFLIPEHRRQEYLNAVWIIAKQNPFFRADHIWQYLGRVGDGARDNGSALGNVLRREAYENLKWIEPADYKPSERGSMHRKRQCVWKSLIYDPTFVPPLHEEKKYPA